MAEHKYTKSELIQRFDGILEKTFEEIDDIGMFEHVLHEDFKLQKGIAGSVIEQCVLRYPPDTKQEADLIVVDNGEIVITELKVTGMRISKDGGKAHFIAKEPMSITIEQTNGYKVQISFINLQKTADIAIYERTYIYDRCTLQLPTGRYSLR